MKLDAPSYAIGFIVGILTIPAIYVATSFVLEVISR